METSEEYTIVSALFEFEKNTMSQKGHNAKFSARILV